MRVLREEVFARGQPAAHVLADGLELLERQAVLAGSLVAVSQVGVRWWVAGLTAAIAIGVGAAFWRHTGRVDVARSGAGEEADGRPGPVEHRSGHVPGLLGAGGGNASGKQITAGEEAAPEAESDADVIDAESTEASTHN